MHEKHFSFYAFQTTSILSSFTNITQHKNTLFFFVFPKNQQKTLNCKTTILHMSTTLHPYVIQCTNWSHTPAGLHEQQKPTQTSLQVHILFKRNRTPAFSLFHECTTCEHKTQKTNNILFPTPYGYCILSIVNLEQYFGNFFIFKAPFRSQHNHKLRFVVCCIYEKTNCKINK